MHAFEQVYQEMLSHLLIREYLANISAMIQTDWLESVKQKLQPASSRQTMTTALPPLQQAFS